jgi:hypothetical protein
MRRKRIQLAASVFLGLLAAAASSSPGRTAISRAFSTFAGAQRQLAGTNTSETSAMAQAGQDLEGRTRIRHGWNSDVINSMLRGTITFYDRDGTNVGQAKLTVIRKYPEQMRVEIDRGNSIEVCGVGQGIAWKSGATKLSKSEARDIRAWLRLCPERLFVTRGSGAGYRETGERREGFKASRPWQEQLRINPPLQLQQVEIEDIIGQPPTLNRAGDRRLITFYINAQDQTVEAARWLEPDDPKRSIDDLSAAKTDVRVDFSDWREVGGVVWPFDIIHRLGGQVDFRISVTTVLVNQTLPETIFQIP